MLPIPRRCLPLMLVVATAGPIGSAQAQVPSAGPTPPAASQPADPQGDAEADTDESVQAQDTVPADAAAPDAPAPSLAPLDSVEPPADATPRADEEGSAEGEGASAEGAEDEEEEEEEPDLPADVGPPPLDPSAPLERFLRHRSSTLDDDRSPTAPPPPVVSQKVGPQQGSAGRPRITLTLKNGQRVEGDVVSESPEGWALRLATGETRFFDRLDVESTDAPAKPRPDWAQKAVLLASLAWPGAGQIVYGALVQKGQPWERSALVVGSFLTAATLAGLALAAVGVTLGLALANQDVPLGLTMFGPANPITLAGLLAVVLAWTVGVLDAGARALLD